MFLNSNCIEKIMYEKGIGLFVIEEINMLWKTLGKGKIISEQ